jgi:DNA-binding response OmpR family regulator
MTDRKTILVVDDDVDILEQVSLTLKQEGYAVMCAEGTAAAEELLLQAVPDLAILDLMMGDMDAGFVLCHQIKRLYPSTPVLMITAVTSSTGLDFSPTNAGEKSWVKADLLLHKPVHPDRLKAAVRQLLHGAAAAPEARPAG